MCSNDSIGKIVKPCGVMFDGRICIFLLNSQSTDHFLSRQKNFPSASLDANGYLRKCMPTGSFSAEFTHNEQHFNRMDVDFVGIRHSTAPMLGRERPTDWEQRNWRRDQERVVHWDWRLFFILEYFGLLFFEITKWIISVLDTIFHETIHFLNYFF